MEELPAVKPFQPGAEQGQKNRRCRGKAQGQKPERADPAKEGIAHRVAYTPQGSNKQHAGIGNQDPRSG
jgi:hypothetical protein